MQRYVANLIFIVFFLLSILLELTNNREQRRGLDGGDDLRGESGADGLALEVAFVLELGTMYQQIVASVGFAY